VEGHGERLGHGRLVEGDRVRDLAEDVVRHGDQLGERAVAPILAAGHAQHPSPLAEVDLSPPAPPAFAAPDGNAFDPPVSRFETDREEAALDWWFGMRKGIDENLREF